MNSVTGESSKAVVQKIMRKFISNEVGNSYSGEGKREKKNFSLTEFGKLLKG